MTSTMYHDLQYRKSLMSAKPSGPFLMSAFLTKDARRARTVSRKGLRSSGRSWAKPPAPPWALMCWAYARSRSRLAASSSSAKCWWTFLPAWSRRRAPASAKARTGASAGMSGRRRTTVSARTWRRRTAPSRRRIKGTRVSARTPCICSCLSVTRTPARATTRLRGWTSASSGLVRRATWVARLGCKSTSRRRASSSARALSAASWRASSSWMRSVSSLTSTASRSTRWVPKPRKLTKDWFPPSLRRKAETMSRTRVGSSGANLTPMTR
mmetsp:Transcript_19476/g.57472  ORF Transcript_19476/g.57472 Transcript_19476/m.57472 type:complete len:269 (-) Transcript_19476:1269-2075(-)